MATVIIQRRTGKNGKRTYGVYYRDPYTGKRKYHKTYYRDKDARKSANKLRDLIDNGKLAEVQKDKVKTRLMTYGSVAASLESKWDNDNSLSPKTLENYKGWLVVTRREFADTLLCEITTDCISQYHRRVASSWTNVTANRHLFIIKQVFKQGMNIRAVFEDPAAEIRYFSEKGQQRNKFIYPDKLQELLAASRKVKAKYLPSLICLGAEHGASKQEALSLTHDDVNFHYGGKGIIRFYRTKNQRERTEFLMPQSKEELQKWLEHQTWIRRRKKISPNGSRLVFSHLDGTPILRFDFAWRKACRLAGLKDFHFHDLRHTFCSNLLLSGADLKDAKDMIGHSDIAMTDRYAHLALQRKVLRQEELAEHYWSKKSSVEDIWKMEQDLDQKQQKRRKS